MRVKTLAVRAFALLHRIAVLDVPEQRNRLRAARGLSRLRECHIVGRVAPFGDGRLGLVDDLNFVLELLPGLLVGLFAHFLLELLHLPAGREGHVAVDRRGVGKVVLAVQEPAGEGAAIAGGILGALGIAALLHHLQLGHGLAALGVEGHGVIGRHRDAAIRAGLFSGVRRVHVRSVQVSPGFYVVDDQVAQWAPSNIRLA